MGLSLAEITQQVVDLTDRGESPAFTQLAIVKATLKLHLADLWNRDVVERKVEPDVIEGQRLQIFLSTKLPGFRKMMYLKGYDDATDPANPTIGDEYDESFPGSIRDGYGWRKNNIFYVAGDSLNIYTTAVPPKFLCGYWATPKVSLGEYQSWIADMYPNAIIDEASAEIFGSVGDDDEAKKRRDMFVPNLQIIRMQDIEATGR